MRPFFVVAPAVIFLAGCSTNPEKRVPRAAADAMTGSPWTLTAVASLTMEGSGVIRESAEASPEFTVAAFKKVLNFRKRQWRGDMTVMPVAARSDLERLSMGIVGDREF